MSTEVDIHCCEGDEVFGDFFECPNCKNSYISASHNYCPHCGVKINWRIDGS